MKTQILVNPIALKVLKENAIVLGTSGHGHGFHPWDNLNACPKCGADRAWAVGQDGERFEGGAPYKIKCLKCRYESGSFDNWETCKEEWNKNLIFRKEVEL